MCHLEAANGRSKVYWPRIIISRETSNMLKLFRAQIKGIAFYKAVELYNFTKSFSVFLGLIYLYLFLSISLNTNQLIFQLNFELK